MSYCEALWNICPEKVRNLGNPLSSQPKYQFSVLRQHSLEENNMPAEEQRMMLHIGSNTFMIFYDPSSSPKIIIFDPKVAETTPERVWLSTGVRAIDHCVEALCSINPSSESDEAAIKGLRKLLPALLQCKRDPENLQARLSCQFGGVESMRALALRTALGGSHGIGQHLGPLGVAHGETSCITLPSVMKYNSRVNKEKQMKVLDVMWSEEGTVAVLAEGGLIKGQSDLGDALDAFIRKLELPRTLTQVGVRRDQLDGIAEHCLHSMLCKSNPIPLTDKQQVLDILETMM